MNVHKITVPGKQRKFAVVQFRCPSCKSQPKVRIEVYKSQLTIDRLIAEHRCA